MYIEQAYKGSTETWKYVIGIATIFLGWQVVGNIPLMIVLIMKFIEMGITPSTPAEIIQVLGSNLFLILLIFSFLVGLLTLIFWNKWVHRISMKEFTTVRKKVDFGRVRFGFFLVIVFNLLTFLLDYSMAPENYQWNFDWEKFIILALIVIPFLPLQTSFEEYFVRGYMMQALGVISGKRWVPLLITSVFFGILHILNPEVDKLGYIVMVYYIGTGFLLGIMTLMDDGLELALGYHAGNNILTALLVTSDWTALQTDSIFLDVSDPEVGIEIITPILLYAVILFILAKKYKWTNWKEKLFGKVVPSNPE